MRVLVTGATGFVGCAVLGQLTMAGHSVRYFRVNVTGTLNLLDAMNAEARRSGRKLRLVFASTGAVYGALKPRWELSARSR